MTAPTPSIRDARNSDPLRRTIVLACLIALTLVGLVGGGSDSGDLRLDPAARAVALPGAMRQIDFDDIVYSDRLRRVLVPARRSGLYLVDTGSRRARGIRLERGHRDGLHPRRQRHRRR